MKSATQQDREQFDAIVIGSGLGGLVTAAYLCAMGRRTLVLEAHYVAGGNSQVFRRKHQAGSTSSTSASTTSASAIARAPSPAR